MSDAMLNSDVFFWCAACSIGTGSPDALRRNGFASKWYKRTAPSYTQLHPYRRYSAGVSSSPATMNTTTASTAPAAAGLAIASLAAELLVAALAAVLIPLIALVLALAGYGHGLVAARRRAATAEAAEASSKPVTAVQLPAAPTSPAPELRSACDASYQEVGAAVIAAQRIKQLATYQRLAAQQVTALRVMAREAGHRGLARKGRRGQLLAALVPA